MGTLILRLCSLAGVRRLGELQAERRPGGFRDPVRQSRSQRPGGGEVRPSLRSPAPCLRAARLTAFLPRRDASSSFLDPTEGMETAEEQRVHSPPASLVPRLHVLHAKPLQHNNPLLPHATSDDNGACKDACFCRNRNDSRLEENAETPKPVNSVASVEIHQHHAGTQDV